MLFLNRGIRNIERIELSLNVLIHYNKTISFDKETLRDNNLMRGGDLLKTQKFKVHLTLTSQLFCIYI